jgi:hypothetical protein
LGDPYPFANSRRQTPSITDYDALSTCPLLPSLLFMTHAPLAPSPHLWHINHCITSSVQPPKLNRRQPEEGLTVAWRRPNVSSDVRGH